MNKQKAIAPCKLASITIIALLALSIGLFSVNTAAAQTDQTTAKLTAVNTAVDQAFNAVLDAEKAGANVTDLLNQLNHADGVLANAENAYRIGDLNGAASQADTVVPIGQQVTSLAQSAKQDALVSAQNAFVETIALTVIGSIVFVLVLFLVWRRFKRRYIENLSEAKPELVSE